jgi:putative transposase
LALRSNGQISKQYDEATGEWTATLDRAGATVVLHPQQLVLATGMSGIPNIPTIPGADSFQGVQHHSSTAWRKFISGCGILTVVRVRSFYPCCTESTNRMADPQPQAITLSNPQQVLLHALLRQTSCPQALALRLRIVLGAAAGQRNDALAHALDCSLPTVRKWRRRWAEAEAQLAAVEPYPRDLRTLVATVLADAPRSGTPGSFTAEQIIQIVNLACTPPPQVDRPIEAWTPRELAQQVIKQGIVATISAGSVGRFLKRGRSPAASQSLLAERESQGG